MSYAVAFSVAPRAAVSPLMPLLALPITAVVTTGIRPLLPINQPSRVM